MEIDSVNTLHKIGCSNRIHAPIQKVEAKDQVTVSEGLNEAEKVAKWVDMIKKMPDECPLTFQRGSESSDVLGAIADNLIEEARLLLAEPPR